MTLFRTIAQSIYSPLLYHELTNKPFSFSWKYFFKLVFCCALLIAVVLSIKTFPALNSSVKGIESFVTVVYPPDLVITIQDGKAQSNAKEAVTIPMPPAFVVPGVDNLGVINTSIPFSFEEFQKSNALFFLAQDALGVGKSNDIQQKIEVVKLKDLPPITLTKDIVQSLAQSAATFVRYLLPLLGMFTLLLFFVLLSMNLLVVVLGAFLIQGIAKMRGLTLPYAVAYQVGLHAATALLLWDTLRYLALPSLGILWSVLAALVLLTGIAWINIKSHENPQAM